uniref:Uncharacterized protein n=1 Tax=Leersia perrieri TaxID=77586 RepID=A0A0D9WWV0_9ORYZ
MEGDLTAATGNSFVNHEFLMTANNVSQRHFTSSTNAGDRTGMAPSSFVMSEWGQAAASYGTVASNLVGAAMVCQQTQARGSNDKPPLINGPWTREEDEVLRNMVIQHGNRKWAEIAKSLPGRIGKQCRERWINHLHPDIKKDVWTGEEDKILIEAHKIFGKSWSAISRYLLGRSENNIKNHWNATARRLKSKRRLRQTSLLEDYIRSKPSETIKTTPPLSGPAPFDNLEYNTGLISAGSTPAIQAPSFSTPPELVAYTGVLNSATIPSQLETLDLFRTPVLPKLSLNTDHEHRGDRYDLPFSEGNIHFSGSYHSGGCQGSQPSYQSLYPPSSLAGSHVDGGRVAFDLQSSNQANAGCHYYGEEGPNSFGKGVMNNNDIVGQFMNDSDQAKWIN